MRTTDEPTNDERLGEPRGEQPGTAHPTRPYGTGVGEDRAPQPSSGLLRSLLLLAGVAYLLSWVAGLVVFASSTQVRSTGGQVLSAYAGHTGAVVVQFVLTEGVAGLLFGVVLWRLGWVTGGRLGRVIGVTALTAAAISIAQCGIGIVLATSVLSRQDVDAASTAYDLLTRLDGVKMLLLAMTAGATALAIGRSRAALPSLLRVVTAATAIALTLSGVGYLALVDALRHGRLRFAAAAHHLRHRVSGLPEVGEVP